MDFRTAYVLLVGPAESLLASKMVAEIYSLATLYLSLNKKRK